MTLSDGQEHVVKQVYLGLSHGWYVTADQSFAAAGKPGPDGWLWTPVTDAAPIANDRRHSRAAPRSRFRVDRARAGAAVERSELSAAAKSSSCSCARAFPPRCCRWRAPALADLDDVREELTRNIQTSQRELSAAEASVARERGELAQRLARRAEPRARFARARGRRAPARGRADADACSRSRRASKRGASRAVSRATCSRGSWTRPAGGDCPSRARSTCAGISRSCRDARRRTGSSTLPALAARDASCFPKGRSPTATCSPWGRGVVSPRRAGAVRRHSPGRKPDAREPAVLGRRPHAGIEALHQRLGGRHHVRSDTVARAAARRRRKRALWQHLRRGGILGHPDRAVRAVRVDDAAAKAVWLYRLPTPVPALAERVQSALARGGRGASER